VEILQDREASVGAIRVRRALPRLGRRTVGAWCFADHMGPAAVSEASSADIGPHPHIGLQTVTWLIEGELLHRDSLGTEQLIRAGQLNLMTSGSGVSHSEEATGTYRGELHGVQLWVAQPDVTRHAAAAFEHHAELPRVELTSGVATVLVGGLNGTTSPARHDTPIVAVDLKLDSGPADLPLQFAFEHALIVLDGAVRVADDVVRPGQLAYLGADRDELRVATTERTRALLIGGVPLNEPLLMWSNFVARTPEEIELAHAQWEAEDVRFGHVDSPLARIPAPSLVWRVNG
jgi:redox-sensitive bicupin YhaK (pirin superfamily)